MKGKITYIMKKQRILIWFLLRRSRKRTFVLFLTLLSIWFVYSHVQFVNELSVIHSEKRDKSFMMFYQNESGYTDPIVMHNLKFDDSCSGVRKFSYYKHDNIHVSTYDLPNMTSYIVKADKNYDFPAKDTFVSHKENLTRLDIFVVPFSHADPGYGMGFEQYYRLHVKGILDSMVQKLETYHDMTFQWAEVVFLERWWRDINIDMKMRIRKLIRQGQLEIVLGGWVMPDEAVVPVEGLIDQLLEGHQWLQDKLGSIPETSWANDPFGYSGVVPYILKLSGINNMVVLRMHQAIKATLAKMGSLEFLWRPYMITDLKSDILCHVMPYTGYWIRDVCGPNKSLCQEYAFMHNVGNALPVFINDANVAERARLLHEQYRITADLYKYNTLYVGLGEDFSYSRPDDWDVMYSNFKKLMDYMNKEESWNVSIKFGTLKEYFKQVRNNAGRASNRTFPILSGDFFPYSDWNHDYWTGFYTTRPFQKCFASEIKRVIRIADVYLVFLRARSTSQKTTAYISFLPTLELKLRGARRALQSFYHHDGITGTSVQEVVGQYDFKLYQAYTQAMSVLKNLVEIIMSANEKSVDVRLEYRVFRESRDTFPEESPLVLTENGQKLFIVNPLPRRRQEIISIRVFSNEISLTDQSGRRIHTQVNTYMKTIGQGENIGYEVVWKILLEPFAISTVSMNKGFNAFVVPYIDAKDRRNDILVIKNLIFSAAFNSTTGMLVSLADSKGRETRIEATFMWYDTIQSGAYVFRPIASAKPMPLDFHVADVKYLHGELVSEVRVIYKEGIFVSYKIYNTTAVKGCGLHVRTEIDIHSSSSFWGNKEVVLRFHSDLNNKGHFYTDQNGLSLIGRKTLDSLPIGGNFYPITKMVLLEDRFKRLTIHSRQSHGVASLKTGWLEIMLDRTMITDDHKGLGQGVMDNKLTESHFVVQVEYKGAPFEVQEERYTFETKLASLVNEDLQHPIIVLQEAAIQSGDENAFLGYFSPISSSLPCDISLIGMRGLITEELEHNGTSLILHRKSFNCGFLSMNYSCNDNESVTLQALFPMVKEMTSEETSLTLLHRKKSVTLSEDLHPSQGELRSFWIKFN